MIKNQFGFGIVGAGTISGIHAMAIKAIPHAKLLGIHSINKNKSGAFASQHQCTSYERLEDMLANPGIDIVCICTPSGIHMDPALQAIEAGKHCLVEKPLEVTLERCDRIISAANRMGVTTGVVFPSRFYESSRKIKAAIDQKRFGELALGDAYVKWSRTPEYYQSADWRGTWQYDGGGALMNQGIHSVDLLQWYMGDVKAVQSVAANIRHKEIEVEDTIVATLEFANGALGTLVCTTAVYPGALKRIEIMGTTGTAILEESNLIKWEFQQEEVSDLLARNGVAAGAVSHGGVSNPADISFRGHQLQIEDMIAAITNNTRPLVDATEGRKAVEIVIAVYESARTGQKVHLPVTVS